MALGPEGVALESGEGAGLGRGGLDTGCGDGPAAEASPLLCCCSLYSGGPSGTCGPRDLSFYTCTRRGWVGHWDSAPLGGGQFAPACRPCPGGLWLDQGPLGT